MARWNPDKPTVHEPGIFAYLALSYGRKKEAKALFARQDAIDKLKRNTK